ncbi:OmpA/MotB family protein [Croceivirga thetidis]|uniref:OmpA family protein n=1 Tax=Croceivirga thetidis TaxID=2721623 RepID=A0ABX1GQT0_9FLAO|nr:OmpA family protein [Croceivirga thetidis]NKI32297.1 OmpA family protein [Croceivirga thetidis]
MKKIILSSAAAALLLTACVSKKKYVALEANLANTQSQLSKTQVEKEELEAKLSKIEARVEEYNAKINSLKEINDSQYTIEEGTVMNNDTKAKLDKTLSEIDPAKVAEAKTMEEKVNLAVSHNLKKSLTDQEDEIDVFVDKTVVMINIADNLLFKSGSYKISNKADGILGKLAEVINSEPSMEVMVEGHTDSRTINTPLFQDNWDLSVKRATSVVRKLQDDFDVDPTQLIAAGRSQYQPLVENTDNDNMAKNRRTRIVIIPDLDKFFALLDSEAKTQP